MTPTALVTYRNVILAGSVVISTPKQTRVGRNLASLVEYVKLDGVPSAVRKGFTRLKGRGQFAPYASVRFQAHERVGANGAIQRGKWQGAAVGQLIHNGQSLDLLTWNQDLTADEVHEMDPPTSSRPAHRGVALIGCGAFTQNIVVPALHRVGATVAGIADSSVARAHDLAGRLPKATVYSSPADLLASAPEFLGLIIACAHSAHAGYAAQALTSGTPTLLEKPAAVDEIGLRRIMAAALASHTPLRIGHNRRFARDYGILVGAARTGSPVNFQADIEAFWIPDYHWYRAPGEGGRVLGNLTHWIDLAIGTMGDVDPAQIRTTSQFGGCVRIELMFNDGSVAELRLHDVSQRMVGGRERVSIRTLTRTVHIDDWSRVHLEGPDTTTRRHRRRDRGHLLEYADWYRCLGRPAPPSTDLLKLIRSHLSAYLVAAQLATDDQGWQPVPSASAWLTRVVPE